VFVVYHRADGFAFGGGSGGLYVFWVCPRLFLSEISPSTKHGDQLPESVYFISQAAYVVVFHPELNSEAADFLFHRREALLVICHLSASFQENMCGPGPERIWPGLWRSRRSSFVGSELKEVHIASALTAIAVLPSPVPVLGHVLDILDQLAGAVCGQSQQEPGIGIQGAFLVESAEIAELLGRQRIGIAGGCSEQHLTTFDISPVGL